MNIVKSVVIFMVFALLTGCSSISTIEKSADSNNEKASNATTSQTGIQENAEKEMYEAWQTCNNNFYELISCLKNKQYSQISFLISRNIEINNEQLINKAQIEGATFKLGEFTIGKQRSFQLSNDRKQFDTGYEVIYNDGSNIDVCYVTFVKKESKWLIDFIKIDIG